MHTLHIVVLAIIQGLTEFLPISSSAHLILIPQLLSWPDQGLLFDIAVHLGTLTAVFVYFRKELWSLSWNFLQSLSTGKKNAESRLVWFLILATLPTLIVGFFAKPWIETTLRSPLVIAASTLFFGLLLGLADTYGRPRTSLLAMRLPAVLAIAFAQVCALIPGVSRSGVTLSAALAVGLTRTAATRFSFYLSIPIILGAVSFGARDLVHQQQPIDWYSFIAGMSISALVGLACIHLFLKWIESFSLKIFVVYRLVLGLFLILYFYY